MGCNRTVSQKWQLALVIQPFAVKTPSGIKTFHPDQIVEVPQDKMLQLSKKGLVCPLLFSPEQDISYISHPNSSSHRSSRNH